VKVQSIFVELTEGKAKLREVGMPEQPFHEREHSMRMTIYSDEEPLHYYACLGLAPDTADFSLTRLFYEVEKGLSAAREFAKEA
jgi:hypothetical protein